MYEKRKQKPFKERRRMFPTNHLKLTARLGDKFSYRGNKELVFIQTTDKGFNFLDSETGRCVLKSHVYMSNYGGRESGDRRKTLQVWVPKGLAINLRKQKNNYATNKR